jgi:hypothetical protein
MNYFDSKDSSRDFTSNYEISYFYLYLMFHACVQTFDVTRNLVKFLEFLKQLNTAVHVVLFCCTKGACCRAARAAVVSKEHADMWPAQMFPIQRCM